jgi:hypothetical protein
MDVKIREHGVTLRFRLTHEPVQYLHWARARAQCKARSRTGSQRRRRTGECRPTDADRTGRHVQHGDDERLLSVARGVDKLNSRVDDGTLLVLDWGVATQGHPVLDLAWYMVHDVSRIAATHDAVVEDFRRAPGERDDPRAVDLLGPLGF